MKNTKLLLSFIVLASATMSQDLFRLRNDPDLILISNESIMQVDAKKTHSELSAIVEKARSKLTEDKGPMAAGKFNLIFADTTIVSGDFQTAKKELCFMPKTPRAPKEGDDLLEINAFPDANLQIARLMLNSPFLIKTITHFDKKLNFGIFHIFSEEDPSSNSRKIWSKILEDLNEGGLDALIAKHSASLANPSEIKKVIDTRQQGIRPRFIAVMTSKQASGNARYKCFDGFSLSMPSILDIRTKKTPINAHTFSLMPTPYNVFSHFLDPDEPETSLATLPVTGKNMLTVWQELLNKSIEDQEEKAMLAHPTPLHGLTNIGNTCYFNAVTQALFASRGFKELVKSMPLNEELPFNMSSVLSGFFDTLTSTPIEKQRVIPTNSFFNSIQKFLDLKSKLCDEELKYMSAKAGHPFTKISHFSEQIANHGLEHDSGELLTYMLELLRIEAEHRGDEIVAGFDDKLSIISDASTSCKGCNANSKTESMDNILKINLTKGSLEGCLEEMAREEKLTSDNRWKCGTSNCEGVTVSQYTITKWPEILIVQLNRFLTSMAKITSKIGYEQNMIFGDQKYNLMSVIMHHGQTIHAGHYTAAIKSSDDKWYVANDTRVLGPIQFSVMGDAYILIFEKEK